MSELTIDQAIEEKYWLESEISKLINQFQNKTGLEISRVEIRSVNQFDNVASLVYGVSVEVRL